MDTCITKLTERLRASLTPYHTVEAVEGELAAAGYTRLPDGAAWELRRGGRYYTVRDGSALIAFSIGEKPGGLRIVASHTDSPCLKLKGNPATSVGGCTKLNAECYGGGLYYSFLDTPLRIAGRVVYYNAAEKRVSARNYTAPYTAVIPSLAIHMRRDANTGLTVNPQTDLQPIVAVGDGFSFDFSPREGEEVISSDLFLVNGREPCLAGAENELLLAPRLDNLVSVFASLDALSSAGEQGISMIYLADNEEVGSRTKQGAASDFLSRTATRIAAALGEDRDALFSQSFLVSCDNAHAIHPNHPEKSDPTNPVTLGGGVVIKHHANQNYTTDAFSEAVFKAILREAGVPYQDFYMRSDLPCGGTLGAISSSQFSVRSIDIGLPQLAMHAACETICTRDYEGLVAALSAFLAAPLSCSMDGEATVG